VGKSISIHVAPVTSATSNIRPRLRNKSRTASFDLDPFVAIAECQHDFIDTGVSQYAQMPFEQAHAAELQQALGHLPIVALLQAQTAAGCENDGAH
jgi:hypothetical protein